MIAVKNMRKSLTLLVALLMAVTAFAAISFADDSDASVSFSNDGISDSGFKEDKKGTLKIEVNNTEGAEHEIFVTVTDENGKILNKNHEPESFIVPDGKSDIKVRFELGKGEHVVDIKIDDGVTSPSPSASYTIDVEKNIWSSAATYAAVVIIAIIVVIIAVVYMRANPRNKPTTTFTQLEEEKKTAPAEAAAPVKTEKKQYKASSEQETGKIKYTSSRRK